MALGTGRSRLVRDMNEPPENNEQEQDAANEVVTPAMLLLDMESRHRSLDLKIAELYEYPYQDQIQLQRLKKEKLRLKDAIERLKDDMIPDLNA